MAVAANSRAEAARARALAHPPQPNPAPTMAMSLEQPLRVEAPVEEETPEAATLSVTPKKSGKDAPNVHWWSHNRQRQIDLGTIPCQTSFGERSLSSRRDLAPQQAQIGFAVKPIQK